MNPLASSSAAPEAPPSHALHFPLAVLKDMVRGECERARRFYNITPTTRACSLLAMLLPTEVKDEQMALLVEALMPSLRSYDVISTVENRFILILLPDTLTSRATRVVVRVRTLLSTPLARCGANALYIRTAVIGYGGAPTGEHDPATMLEKVLEMAPATYPGSVQIIDPPVAIVDEYDPTPT